MAWNMVCTALRFHLNFGSTISEATAEFLPIRQHKALSQCLFNLREASLALALPSSWQPFTDLWWESQKQTQKIRRGVLSKGGHAHHQHGTGSTLQPYTLVKLSKRPVITCGNPWAAWRRRNVEMLRRYYGSKNFSRFGSYG